MNRDDKSAAIDRLKDQLRDVPAILLADFRGMTVEQTNNLRRQFQAASVHYEVVKNSLVRKAIAGTRMESLAGELRGNTAIAYHREDPSAAARVMTAFLREADNTKVAVKGGWLDGKVLDAEGVKALATLPGKPELRGKLLSVFLGVPTKFVRVLTAAQGGFARVLQARATQLGQA